MAGGDVVYVTRRLLPVVRYVLPALFLLAFAHEKLELNPVSRYERMADGLFYYQIAQHVAAGDGLQTSASLFGKGLRELPAPTTVQPLWPLVLGFSGRWIGLDRAAAWVPELLYFTGLLLLYSLGNRIGRSLGAESIVSVRGVTVLDLGTVGVALLGSNAVFSAYTSKAYTDGLAFTLLFGALLALPRWDARRLSAWAGLAGALAGLAYLARSQLVGAPLALAAALAIGGIREARLRRAALASMAASAAVVLPWILHLVASLGSFPVRVLVDFTAYRETPALPALVLVVERSGLRETLLDLASSFFHAFHVTSRQSYVDSFGPMAYAVPAAIALVAWQGWRRSRAQSPPGFVPDPKLLLPLATLLVAAAACAPLHAAHMAINPEWLFGGRHGLPLILAIVLAAGYLARHGAVARLALIAALAVSVFLPARQPAAFIRGVELLPWPAEKQLMAWLDGHPRPPVVLTRFSRSIAAQSQAVAHSLVCARPEVAMRQLEALPIDYLIVYSFVVPPCAPLPELLRGLELVKQFEGGTPIHVFRRAP